jgi:Family of unknown function (DUF6922)
MHRARTHKTSRRRLPEMLRPFFWDYRFGSLSWEKDQHLVIARTLEVGSLTALRWLRRKLGDDALREWLLQRQGRGLSRQQLRFWEVILDIPRRIVDKWLSDPRRRIWDERCDR